MLIVIALIAVTLFVTVRSALKSKKASAERPETGEGNERNPTLSLPLSIGFFALYAWALVTALQWSRAVAQFPLVVTIPGVILLCFVLYADFAALRRESAAAGTLRGAMTDGFARALVPRTLRFFAYLAVIVILTLAVGQKIALAAFVFLYLWRWTEYGWHVRVLYTAGALIFLVGFYDRVMHLLWHPSWLEEWAIAYVPGWFPTWVLF